MVIKYLILFESFVIAALVGFDVKFVLCFGFNMNDFLSTMISVACALPIPAIASHFISCSCNDAWEN